MTHIRLFCVLAFHLFQLVRTGQLRFRLETYGLYYPDLPYASHWWKFHPRVALSLVRETKSYARWLSDMQLLFHGEETTSHSSFGIHRWKGTR